MAVLQIGRVGLDIDVEGPRRIQFGASQGNRTVTVTLASILAATLAEVLAIQTELENQVGQLIPFTFVHDNTWDGFYVLDSVNIEAEDYALNDSGLLDGAVTMIRVGGASATRFQIMSTSAVMANDHTIDEDDVLFHTAPPVGAYAYNARGVNTINSHVRSTEDGDIVCQVDIDANPAEKPSWAVEPADYYKGGCRLYVGNPLRLRTGTDIPNLPADWMLSNGVIRITPGVTTGANNGRLGIAAWDGSAWDAPVYFKFVYDPAGANDPVPAFHSLTVVEYTPERTIIRLERDADEFAPTTFLHKLDIHMRRGDPYVSCRYQYTGEAVGWEVAADTAVAATDVSPAGGVTGIIASSAVNGHKWTLVTPHTIADTDNGAGNIQLAAMEAFSFGLGMEVNSGSADPLDQAASIHIQYLARTEERERAVRR